jgi:peptidase C39-like protein
MIILLAISFACVAAGLFLSPKPHVRSQRAVSTVRMGRRIVVEQEPARTRSIVESERLNVRRLPMDIERYAGVASIPLRAGRDFGQQPAGKSAPWAVVIIGLLSIFFLGLYLLNILLPHPALWSFVSFYGNAPAATPSSQNTLQYNASQSLVRLSQLDPGQYASSQEYSTWAYSACSTAAMTEVFNAYGHHYLVTDILKVEAQIGEITPQLGLLEDVGIQRTAAQFGFKTTWGHNLSLDQIIDIANHGRPVIVSFPPDRYDGGHLLVVTGGNSSTVYLADSSRWNRQSLSRAQFLQWWEGFYAIATPK